MTCRVAVISPCVVVHHLDPHTGIPFMPHMAAYLAGALDRAGQDVQVIDCFGLDAHNRRIFENFMLLGISEELAAKSLEQETKVAFLYCRTIEDLISVERIAGKLRDERPEIELIFFENIQTVNSFSLRVIAPDLIGRFGGVAVFGEPELRASALVDLIVQGKSRELSSIAGVGFLSESGYCETPDEPFNRQLDDLALPLWEKFPLEGYWKVQFAHAPCDGRKFLPMLTSRGCPFRCTFCVSPAINPTWRGRSGKSVVDEMEYFYRTMGVTDFHVSDLDPTVHEKRTRDICQQLIARKLPVTWKLAQGTKIETIKSENTLELLRESGLTFLSFSPESGSPRMLKIMNKVFDHALALRYVRKMNTLGIRTQACFIAGVPGENEADRQQSISYVKDLVKNGVDEIAVTIFTPIPGAALAKAMEGYQHYSELTHSPTWRKDYREVQWFRIRMYLVFFWYKALFSGKVAREIWGLLTRKFQTKMEMALFKQAKLYLLYFFPFTFSRSQPQTEMQRLKSVRREIG